MTKGLGIYKLIYSSAFINANNAQSTSKGLNEALPIKWPHKSYKENYIFTMEKAVGPALKTYAKRLFTLDKY